MRLSSTRTILYIDFSSLMEFNDFEFNQCTRYTIFVSYNSLTAYLPNTRIYSIINKIGDFRNSIQQMFLTSRRFAPGPHLRLTVLLKSPDWVTSNLTQDESSQRSPSLPHSYSTNRTLRLCTYYMEHSY